MTHCHWTPEAEDGPTYRADCHPTWLYAFNEEPDAHWAFCPYCGRPLVWVVFELWKDEDEEHER